jgi:hypothetical protein
VYESLVRDDPDQDEILFTTANVDYKTLRDASSGVITFARLIRSCLRAMYEETMVLYLNMHSHSNLTTDI